MLEDEAFMQFWKTHYTKELMTFAVMDLAYTAWLAAYDLGFDEGKATSQAISSDVLNFGKRKNKRS